VASTALSAALLLCHGAAAGAPASVRNVVLLTPDNTEGAPGGMLVRQSLRDAFAAGSSEAIQIRNESLDLSRFHDTAQRRILVDFLRQKYAGQKIDLVIAGLSSSLDFALEFRRDLFPGVPIVFVGVDQQEVQKRSLPADVIGVPMKMDLAGTLDLALRLQPATRRVFVVTGSSPFDLSWERVARQTFRTYEDKLEFVYLSGLPMADLVKRVASLPAGSIVQYLHVFQDGAGQTFIPAKVLEVLAATANAPIYGHVDSYIGRGIVGGRVMSFEMEGKNAAGLGLRILAGERLEKISVRDISPNVNMVDWRQLRRWGLSEAGLPPGSDVRYRQPGLWDLYHWHIIGALSLFALQTGMIVALLAQRAHRRRADVRFWQVVATAPYGVLMVRHDGRIAMANAQAEKLFGYRREEIVGQPVEMLVPERFRHHHSAHRERFSALPVVRPMGAGQELFARRKDGTEFPVEIALSPAQPSAGRLVLATIVDISLRRQAEESLRLSQIELRKLTGRLLQAHEDESRRIARELHDDLGQGLALLTVELDLLRQKPLEASRQIGARIQGLLAHVKHLSSSVHDMSHQLHPSKLEQLGLVAAIGGLCKELTASHGLEIAFTDRELPAAIAPDTAVCLYRFAQEALRNAVKHSGAQHAAVALSATADAISLRIVDDGVGFDPKLVQGKGGLGLVSMRERVLHLGGEIAIDSQPSGGTRLYVSVPLRGGAPVPAI
jgi:PAS domain S-box-containing protein